MRRASYLSPPHFKRLDWACRPVRVAFNNAPYLVGTVLERGDFRDVDVRLILDDDDPLAQPSDRRDLLNVALSTLVETTSGLPYQVDFQIQSQSEADEFDGPRNPLGIR